MKSLRRSGKGRGTRRGMLTFEWILLISLLVIGIIGGLSAVRNSLLCELNDLDQCIQALNTCDTPEDEGLPEVTSTSAPWWQQGSAE